MCRVSLLLGERAPKSVREEMGKFKVFLCLIAMVYETCAFSKLPSLYRRHRSTLTMEIFENNPVGKMLWNAVWKLEIMKPGIQGKSPTTFGDAANVLKCNILQLYGDQPSVDGALSQES